MIPNKWKPLFVGSSEKQKILSIIQSVSENLIVGEDQKYSGLLSGKAGLSLFWEYKYLLTSKKVDRDTAVKLIENALASISETPLPYTYSNGISGIIWSYSHLIETGACYADLNEIVSDEIDLFLRQSSNKNIHVGNYDYLHGGSGVILYFLARKENDFAKKSLHDIVIGLNEISNKFDDGIAWRDLNKTDEELYNLGLSHGVPSLIVLLSRILQEGISPELTKHLLEKSVLWLLNKKNTDSATSLFPTTFSLNTSYGYSRLGWCYGDLGIAITLLQVGEILNNKELKNTAIEIALHASRRRDLENNIIRDAGLCHGTAGVAHIFNRLYQQTGEEELKDAAKYWFFKTFEFYESPCGFKVWRKNTDTDDDEWVDEDGLLEGKAGIGLALIASISDIEPKWDRCLLLS